MNDIQWKVDNGIVRIGVSGYRDMNKRLNSIDPKINRDLKKDYRRIAKPGVVAVQAAIPITPPTSGIHRKRKTSSISGFYPVVIPGRTTWGTVIPAKKVSVETRAPRVRKGKGTSIARLRVQSPATVIADMAGTRGKYNARPRTREYLYSGATKGKPAGFIGTRSHRVNGQGEAMVSALKRFRNTGKRSRFIYPAFDKVAPAIRREALLVIEQTVNKLNTN